LTDYKNGLLKFITNLIELPKNPKQAADLITRARTLLGRRTKEEIEAIDNSITFILDDFSKILKQEHGGNYKRHMATVLNIKSDIDLLKYCLNEYAFGSIGDIEMRTTMCDYFAVYGIRHVAMAHLVITATPPQGLNDIDKVIFRDEQKEQANDFIYIALDCISYAERLKENESLIIKIDALESTLKQIKDNQQAEIQVKVKRAISKKASEAGKKAHKEDYIDRNKVYEWLSGVLKTDVDFLKRYSADKIASIIDREEIVSVTHRTICGYIKNYKDELLKKAS
jgi:hypothetical protein